MKGSLGGPVAALATVAVVVSMFVPFWDGAAAYELAIRGLWQGYAGLSAASFLTSIAMILSFGALMLMASTVAGSQALSFLGFFWVGGLLVLFTEKTRGPSSVTDYLANEADWGFWVAAAGAALALIAGFIPRSVSTDFRN